MAFLPPFGMINPLPTVNHNDFQDWMRGYKSRKQPKATSIGGYKNIRVAFVPSKSVRSHWVRFLTTTGRDFVRRYDSITYDSANRRMVATYPRRGNIKLPPKRSSEELFNDIQRFLREQARTVRPRGLAVIIPKANYRTGTAQPWPRTLAYAMGQLMTSRPTERKTSEDREKPFDIWLERRYSRKHPSKYMRRYR